MDIGCLRTPVDHRDLHQDIIDPGLGIFDQTIKVTVLVKNARIGQFEFRTEPVKFVFDQQFFIRKCRLRILVQVTAIGVSGGGSELIVDFFYIFPMISFRIGETIETLFNDRIFFIP